MNKEKPAAPPAPKAKPKRRKRSYNIEAVLREQGIVVFDDGSHAPVLQWTDLTGADVAKEVADVAIAKHAGSDSYAHIIIDGFEPEVWH